eukprot:TRINITY_DN15664_c0_g1_i1.p1 TRINITY_DN15664_c0_g1~~TRINITY_DN15664_c0_g1_i1.p1  ORF type:complete len:245 (-),score=60.83 TRINITY_DN15664_c0_g1_i1:15-749(-)
MARSRASPAGERKSPRHTSGGTGSFKESGGNSLKRFGQSIKRIVREVEEQNTVDETREVLVTRNVVLTRASSHLNKCYLATLNTVVTLQNQYLESKNVKNILKRYSQLRAMIKVVSVAESSWLPLSVLPTQCRTDSVPVFVEKSADAILTTSGVEEDRRKVEERLIELTSKQVSDENTVLVNDLYRLIKKYQAIRNIVRTLVKDYNESKIYPIIPRYILLRDMVKDATHHPDYKEYCHEATVSD